MFCECVFPYTSLFISDRVLYTTSTFDTVTVAAMAVLCFDNEPQDQPSQFAQPLDQIGHPVDDVDEATFFEVSCVTSVNEDGGDVD